MGKTQQQILRQQQSDEEARIGGSSDLLCEGCSMALSRVAKQFNFKCFFFLIFGFSVFLSGIFWVLPLGAVNNNYGFEAKEAIKLSATVQAYFRLEVPVKEFLPQIERVEYDINGEIGVPDVKVSILSMHQLGISSNWTYVVFGFLSDPINAPINQVSLSVLKSSLVELFLRQSNLTLTTSSLGQPSSFEILKFYGGITVVPLQSSYIWKIPQILFNFTLNNSMSEILERSVEFRDQLKIGLRLRPYENVYVQITNKNGSTILPPVIIQASVFSDLGNLIPQRLKQLAEIIMSFPARNLGFNDSVFGEVKSISLSSYLKGALQATSPTYSPAPSPELSDLSEPSTSPNPASSSYMPVPSPVSTNPTSPPSASAPYMSYLSPDLSPIPEVSCSYSAVEDEGNAKYLVSTSFASSSSSLVVSPLDKLKLFGLFGLCSFLFSVGYINTQI